MKRLALAAALLGAIAVPASAEGIGAAWICRGTNPLATGPNEAKTFDLGVVVPDRKPLSVFLMFGHDKGDNAQEAVFEHRAEGEFLSFGYQRGGYMLGGAIGMPAGVFAVTVADRVSGRESTFEGDCEPLNGTTSRPEGKR